MTSTARESPSLAKPMKRCNKPMMEKRRRERINKSLDDLKSLVLQASNKNSAQYNKLEKADILEMTVRHLRNMQQHQLVTEARQDPGVTEKFGVGFRECAVEVSRYLSTMEGLGSEVRSRLLNHLGNCASRLGAPSGHHPVPMATQMNMLPGSVPEMPREQLMTSHRQPYATQVSKPSISEVGLVHAQLYYMPSVIVGHSTTTLSPGIGSPDSGISSPDNSPVCSRTTSPIQNQGGDVLTAVHSGSDSSALHVAPPTSKLVVAGPSKVWRPW